MMYPMKSAGWTLNEGKKGRLHLYDVAGRLNEILFIRFLCCQILIWRKNRSQNEVSSIFDKTILHNS